MSTSTHIPSHARRVEVLTHREGAGLKLYTMLVEVTGRGVTGEEGDRIYIDHVRNLARVAFAPQDVDLDADARLEIVFSSLEVGTVQIVLEGYPTPPTSVSRGNGTGTWSWDPVAQTVTLFEGDSATYPMWTIEP